MALGIGFMRLCALKNEFDKAKRSTRPPAPPIRKVSKPPPCQVLAGLMRERKSMVGNVIYWWTLLGLLITVVVTTACVQDRDGLKKLLRTFGVHRKKLRKIWVDGGYRGYIAEWVKARFRYCLEVVLRSDEMKGFVVLPKRWIVERTFAWLNNHRRLSKDYERYPKTSETMIQIVMIRVMLRRLQPL